MTWRTVVLAVLEEIPGVLGLALLFAGVYRTFGLGWALIALGAVLFGFYVWRETRAARWRARRKS